MEGPIFLKWGKWKHARQVCVCLCKNKGDITIKDPVIFQIQNAFVLNGIVSMFQFSLDNTT